MDQIFELSMVLDNEKFQKVLGRACKKADCLQEDEGEYIDQSLDRKGMTVIYRDSQYKKKVKLLVNPGLVLDRDAPDPDRLIRKLDKHIKEYFEHRYRLDALNLSGMRLTADIDVRSHGNVSDYLKVLQRIGRVKGFSPSDYDCFDDIDSFCLDGNSNGIEFLLYDLEALLIDRLGKNDIEQKRIKAMSKDAEGIIRAEVRLTKPKAVRSYTSLERKK